MTNDTDPGLEDVVGQLDGSVTVDAVIEKRMGPATALALRPMSKGNDAALDDLKLMSEEVPLTKGWMKFHRMELVRSADKVRELVDRAIQVGHVALDTETQGLDTRIEYRLDGSPYTQHSIIGYCIGLEGEGYYIPVRHKGNVHEGLVNIDSVEQAESEITRLCLAAQPVLKEGFRDILGAKEEDFETPPRVIIEFWHAKFDQEMLYPITGIDIWNPFSFEDGMLMVYALDSDAEQNLKENARLRLPPIVDPETGNSHAYEMIEFAKLFARGMKKRDRKLEELIPREDGEGHNVVLYGCSDGICTNLLCKLLGPKVRERNPFLKFYTLEKQVVQVVRIIERTRVLINKGEIASLLEEADEELVATEKVIRNQAVGLGFPKEFNPSSSAQLADFLFGPKGVWKGDKPEKTKEGQFKTDEKTIEEYTKEVGAPEVFTLVLKHRRINKVRGTYLQNLANNTDLLDQLRLNFKPTGAATGRFTAPSGAPDQGYAGIPIQGIPARDDPKKPKVAHSLRRMFIARPKYVMVKVDYASQELRIAASMSGEQKWIAEYEKETQTGESADLHFLTAQAFFPGLTKGSPDYKIRRNAGKTANFALIYGGGVDAVQRATGCDKVEGARLKAAFDSSVPQFAKWVRGQKESVKNKLGIYTAFGRFIAIPDASIDRDQIQRNRRATNKEPLPEPEAAQEASKIRAACERKAINFPIQGSGADILKISLVRLLRELDLRGWLKNGGDDSVRILMTVHDEIVFEIREERVGEAVPIIVKIMEHPSVMKEWRVPLIAEAEIGPSWAAKISWSAILKGTTPRPAYLEGVEINPHPEVLVLGGVTASLPPSRHLSVVPASPVATLAPKPELVAGAVVDTAPDTVALETVALETVALETVALETVALETVALETVAIKTEPPALPTALSPANGNGSPRHRTTTKIASFKLRPFHVTKKNAIAVAGALAAAKIEGIRLDQPEKEMVIEFLAGGPDRVLLYSAQEGYRVHVQELEINLRRLDLLDSWVEREEVLNG
jgi:DNA polymerase I-like protein with 3'-5' exonuclease and polymerase domains